MRAYRADYIPGGSQRAELYPDNETLKPLKNGFALALCISVYRKVGFLSDSLNAKAVSFRGEFGRKTNIKISYYEVL